MRAFQLENYQVWGAVLPQTINAPSISRLRAMDVGIISVNFMATNDSRSIVSAVEALGRISTVLIFLFTLAVTQP